MTAGTNFLSRQNYYYESIGRSIVTFINYVSFLTRKRGDKERLAFKYRHCSNIWDLSHPNFLSLRHATFVPSNTAIKYIRTRMFFKILIKR